MMITRAQWPHTVQDIVSSLDGIWGLVGAIGVNGNLFRLERSLHEPLIYTMSEHKGSDEGPVVNRKIYQANQKEQAVDDFAAQLGFK